MRELRTAVRVDVPQSVEYVELCIDAYAHVLLLGGGTLVRVRVEAETVVVVVAGRCAKGWQESAPCVCLSTFASDTSSAACLTLILFLSAYSTHCSIVALRGSESFCCCAQVKAGRSATAEINNAFFDSDIYGLIYIYCYVFNTWPEYKAGCSGHVFTSRFVRIGLFRTMPAGRKLWLCRRSARTIRTFRPCRSLWLLPSTASLLCLPYAPVHTPCPR